MPRVVEARPVPQSAFISAAQSSMSPTEAQPNMLRQGALAQKLIAMKREKNKAIEEQKLAVLEARYAAQVKKAEETARKKLELEKQKAEMAQLRAREAAEKREKKRYEA